jgi:hypothetical protein
MKTLAELNANPYRREWDGLLLETRYAVARGGMKAGDKVHLVRTEVVIENHTAYPDRAPVGGLLNANRICNGRGKYTARPVAGWDTDKVNCGLCRGEQ